MSTPNVSDPNDAAMYSAVAARRLGWDNMLWQVPTMSLTGQAFLFTIALGNDSSRAARIISCLLAIVMTLLSMHLMARHRQAEWTDAHWLEEYEKNHFGRSWHGKDWAEERNKTSTRGRISPILIRHKGFEVWIGGLVVFGLAALTVFVLTIFWPTLLGK